jgi:hypothetical protein
MIASNGVDFDQIMNVVGAVIVPILMGIGYKIYGFGERLAKLEGENEAMGKDIKSLVERIEKRFDELRADIKELTTTKEDRTEKK